MRTAAGDTPVLDEMVDGNGQIRPHWRALIGAVGGLGKPQLDERAGRLARAAEDEGVASLLPGITSTETGWRCDPIPLPITAREFAALEAGLTQRARLLEAVLADIYGPQHLLKEGLLPAALVFANPHFLRPGRHATNPPHRPMLHLAGMDVIRCPDGIWRVVSDRTAMVSGLGYALENRRLMNQAMAEALVVVKPRALSSFFELWQESLQRLAPHGRTAPAVALLSPGHMQPHWFEHVVLGREISAALVEAGDLTVRGGGLYLKTLAGLQQVDVLLNRAEAAQLDPMEFPAAQATAGVPGLLDAARHGALTVLNAPGAGLAESPALMAFLPALCRRLLGEELLLESLETHWLSTPGARDAVAASGDDWLLRPATDGAAGALPMPGIEAAARPGNLAATRWPIGSQAPSFGRKGLAPMPVMLRLFAISDGEDWHALPGGFARALEADHPVSGRLPQYGLSKDVWVLAEDEAPLRGPGPQALPPLPIRRSAGALPSRVADNLFWLGRYVERLDRAARLIRAVLARLRRGSALPHESAEVLALARCLRDAGLIGEEAMPTLAGATGLVGALGRAASPEGAVGQLQSRVAGLAGMVRDRLTADMHAAFTHALRKARAAGEAAPGGLDMLSRAMVANMRFATVLAGVAAENMVRGGAWLFLDLGRRVERGQSVLAEIEVLLKVPPARVEPGLKLILELCDSVITYRSRYLAVVQPAPVLDLVLADPSNPRGLAFQLAAIQTALTEVSGDAEDDLAEEAATLTRQADALVHDVLGAHDQPVAAAALPPRLTAMAETLRALSDAMTRRYFALLPPARALGLDEATEPADVLP
ncbi:hypothetical protein EOD42_20970 [Rhodovarius crocodyli]|uniref:Uncharacterized protein n=1 Tax=Rhodovarius crocodyli TaxID=1979269 RepID=A0A437M246_9PROT|nr:circularly permuted type 2 ATP-grasp protein [Rhodovarius crocodyli]RVT91790.1 hypothetical protein EOD42_20970 [Rhodovarius crocodyli]